MSLTAAQKEIANRIGQYGIDNGFTNSDINLAVDVALIESSLGQNLQNPASSASGLYQYTNDTWSDRHSAIGEKNNIDNQIKAFYADLSNYHGRYANNVTYEEKSDMTFNEYTYTKHHDGWNYDDFDEAPGKLKFREFILESNDSFVASDRVTLCIIPEAYIFEGSGTDLTDDPLVVNWLEQIDRSGTITQKCVSGVSRDDAQAIINVSPTEAFYIDD